LKEVVQFYAGRAGLAVNVVEEPIGPPKWKSGFRDIPRLAAGQILNQRDLMAGYVLPYFPALEMHAKAFNLMRRARSELSVQEFDTDNEVFRLAYRGEAHGKRLVTLSDSHTTMEPYADRVCKVFAQAEAQVLIEVAGGSAAQVH